MHVVWFNSSWNLERSTFCEKEETVVSLCIVNGEHLWSKNENLIFYVMQFTKIKQPILANSGPKSQIYIQLFLHLFIAYNYTILWSIWHFFDLPVKKV